MFSHLDGFGTWMFVAGMAGLYGSGSTGLMKLDREVVGEWRSLWLLRAACLGLEDSVKAVKLGVREGRLSCMVQESYEVRGEVTREWRSPWDSRLPRTA